MNQGIEVKGAIYISAIYRSYGVSGSKKQSEIRKKKQQKIKVKGAIYISAIYRSYGVSGSKKQSEIRKKKSVLYFTKCTLRPNEKN